MQVTFQDLSDGHRLLKCPCGEDTLQLADQADEVWSTWFAEHKAHHPGYGPTDGPGPVGPVDLINIAPEADEIRTAGLAEQIAEAPDLYEENGVSGHVEHQGRPVETIDGNFFEENEPVEQVKSAFLNGQDGVLAPPQEVIEIEGVNHSHVDEPFDLVEHIEDCHEDLDPDVPLGVLEDQHNEKHQM